MRICQKAGLAGYLWQHFTSFPPGTDIDESNWAVRDGIVVIPKSTILYLGTYIGPE